MLSLLQRNALIEANIPLARHIVLSYSPRSKQTEAEMLSDALLGLSEAARRFKPSRGKFGSYAGHWVRRYLFAGMHERRYGVYIPRNSGSDALRLKSLRRHDPLAELKTDQKTRYAEDVGKVSVCEFDESFSVKDRTPLASDTCQINEMMSAVKDACVSLELDEDDVKLLYMDSTCHSDILDDMAKRWGLSQSSVKMRKKRVLYLIRKELCRRFGKREIEAFFRG